MEYRTSYQIIILLDDTLSLSRKRYLIRDMKNYMEKWTKKISTKYIESRDLAYKIDNHEKAWMVVMKIKLKPVGSTKRIKEIEEKLNTYEEIIDFKIVEKSTRLNVSNKERKSYIVYEFDYGDIEQCIEPHVTIFDGYFTRESAEEKANELLKEGLERYFIENRLIENKNPFKDNDEVHLYEKEAEDEQENSVYYIKIQKINLK